MPAFATSSEFLDRVDDRFVDQLAAPSGGMPDAARITASLDDATAELEGWMARIPSERRPADALLKLHCVKIALYLLTLNRPVADFDQIRKAYEDVIAFYQGLVAEAQGAAAGGGRSERPCPAFDDDSLEGFV